MTVEIPVRPVRRSNGQRAWHQTILSITGAQLLTLLWQKRQVMFATTRLELKKRYSGSILGQLWVVLQPVLFFSVYLFVYLLVFKIVAPGKNGLEYVLYIFCGLVPFMTFMEVFSASCIAIKQNAAMVRNVILPIEFIPFRTVCMALVPQAAGFGIVLILAIVGGKASWHLLWFPVVLALQILMFTGLALFMSSLGIVIPDLGYMSGIISIALMQVSPIAYTLDMLPHGAAVLVTYLNPLTPMMEMFRASIVDGRFPDPVLAVIYVVTSLGIFMFGNAAFARFKDLMDDYV